LADDNTLQRCLDRAYHYLNYRPRSEAELRQQLHQQGFENTVVEEALSKLKEQNLVDDLAFARSWRDARLSFRPKSKRLIERELKDKKVAAEIIDETTKDIDDENNAYKLGRGRLPGLAHSDYHEFRRRLSNYLHYRGFAYEIIKRVINALWQEREQPLG